MTLTILDLIHQEQTKAFEFYAEFRSDGEQNGYPILLRSYGSVADTLLQLQGGEKVIIYGSFWSRTKHNLAWIDVDFAFQSNDFINHFSGIGKVFKSPTAYRSTSKFPLLVNRTINQKHYYSIVSVGNAASMVQSLLSEGDLVNLEGYIDLINWTNKQGEVQHFLKFTNIIIKRF